MHLTSLDPTENLLAAVNVEDNVTVTMLNCSQSTLTYSPPTSPTVHLMAARAKSIFGQPLQEYLNAIRIAAHQAIADMEATLIFIMGGVDVVKRCLSTKALTIKMPDGRKVKSTHICDVTIPGLPETLTGHIVRTLPLHP